MKVLFDHPSPFLLAHGGFQIQIEQTKAGLEGAGVEVEYLRWWDEGQTGDVIHYFGRPVAGYIDFAHRKGMKVVLAELLTGLGSRGNMARRGQKLLMRTAQNLLPKSFHYRMGWESYRLADASIAGTAWERHLMVEMFGASPEKVHCVPNGVEEVFFQSPVVARGPWLVCAATITERKRVMEVAEAAVRAKTPLWVVGQPYSPDDPYGARFVEFARGNPRFVRYEGAIRDRKMLATVYREARGFVLLSTMESLSLASMEATACGCPLLLSDLPWARSTFGENATYCPVNCSSRHTAETLRSFYERAVNLPPPPKPPTWIEIGEKLLTIYKGLSRTSR